MFGCYKEGDYAAIRLDTQLVIDACRRFLDARKDRIFSEHEELIAAIQERGVRRWPRFWRKERPNRTEAIMIAKRSDDLFGSQWYDIEHTGWFQAERVGNLFKVALLAQAKRQSFIVLSEAAVRDIAKYLEGEESGNDEEGKGADAGAPRGTPTGAGDATYAGCVTGHPGP